MQLKLKGQEQIKAPPSVVWAFMHDPEQVATCIPEIQDIRLRDDQHVEATITVGQGFFKGKVGLLIGVIPEVSQQQIKVNITGSGLGSNLKLDANTHVQDNNDGTTTLDWDGEAEMNGPLTKLGGNAAETEAEKMMSRIFANISNEIEKGGSKLA